MITTPQSSQDDHPLSSIWRRMPDHLFWTHVLPRCDIETRVGFKARAPRVKLPPLDPLLQKELERYLLWRRDGPKPAPICNEESGYSYTIPYWKHGARRWRFGAPSANTWTLMPKVYLFVWYSTRGYAYDEYIRKDVSWNMPKGTTRVYVEKIDALDDARPHDREYKPIRSETHVATFFIAPSTSTPELRHLHRRLVKMHSCNLIERKGM